MVADDQARRQLHLRLEEVLGADAATTLIEGLHYADLATTDDLGRLGERVEVGLAEIDTGFVVLGQRLDARLDVQSDIVWEALLQFEVTLAEALRAHMTTVVFALAGAVLTMVVLAFALARLTS